MQEPDVRQGQSTAARVLIYCVLVVALTVIGFFIGNWHAKALCDGGDCGILVILIFSWTLAAFVASLLAVLVAEVVRQLRSGRAD